MQPMGEGCDPPAPVDDAPDGEGGSPDRLPTTRYETMQRRLAADGVAFGARVRALRRQRGWTLKDLRRASGVPVTTLSNLENGQSLHPDPALVMTLSELFEAPGPAAGGFGDDPLLPAGVPEGITLERLVREALRGYWGAQDEYAARGDPGGTAPVQGGAPVQVAVAIIVNGGKVARRVGAPAPPPAPDPPAP